MTSTAAHRRDRIAYVTQWFPPEPAGASLWIAQAIQSSGRDVHVVTSTPNYPEGVVYPGYSTRRVTNEVIEGLKATRCPAYPSHDRSALKRAANYLSFAASASWHGREALRTADAAVVYSSPATSALPALLARALGRTPYVLIIQDLWPDTVLETGFLGSGAARTLAKFTLGVMDRVTCERASQILVISCGMREALISRGVPPEKVTVMHNWVDEKVIYPRDKTGRLRQLVGASESDLVLLYAGNHGPAQDLGTWLEALRRVRDLSSLHVVFMGNGIERDDLASRAQRDGLDRVHFLEAVGLEEYVVMAADADAQIVSLADQPLFRITIPGKVQACLALGSCVIASLAGDAAELVHEADAGYVAEPGNIDEIEQAIRLAYAAGPTALRVMGESARDFYLARLSRERGSAILASEIESAVAAGSGRSAH